ncbi:MAG: sulfotransferase domain-containing protein, partial [Chloroflexi bacterium]|nr:sulfotransferase domain-containing protein [Chloroflexota bacterium]
AADVSNPNGYYEFEPVKSLKDGDAGWLAEAQGRVVKIVSPLLAYLPPVYRYKVIFMQRDLREVLASQTKMLDGMHKASSAEQDRMLEKAFSDHLSKVGNWAAQQPNLSMLYLSYNRLFSEPERILSELADFLGRPLDTASMLTVIDPKLYRNRQAVLQPAMQRG